MIEQDLAEYFSFECEAGLNSKLCDTEMEDGM